MPFSGRVSPVERPPAVFAADAVSALDQAHVSKGVILSCAYLYGLPSLHLKPREVAALTRHTKKAAEIQKEFTSLIAAIASA
jgi:hypothetical protein